MTDRMNKSLEEAVVELVTEILSDPKRTLDVVVAAVLAEKALKDGESVDCIRERLRLAIID
jgi:hypothetical protein